MSHSKQTASKQMGRPKGSANIGSLPDRIVNLDVGESLSITVRVPIEKARHNFVSQEAERLSNNLRAATRRAQERTENEYVVESGSFLSRNENYIVSAVVTRLA